MKSAIETEVKIRLLELDSVREKLARLGFKVSASRVFEANTLYDRNGELRGQEQLLRLREAGDKHVITFKGRGNDGPHKQREEIETSLGSAREMAKILERLGYQHSFRYEKYRTEFQRPGEEQDTVTLDETPIGFFMELEGPGEWIDATARELGFTPNDYLLDSYGKLYLAECKRRGVEPTDMVFSS
jgi:adenylate cyclase class 2